MTNRFFAGFHPNFGTAGVWLSKPGIDVLSVGPATNFLLRPDFKVEQVVLSGTINIPRSNPTATVFYPATFTKRPYIFFKPYTSSGVVEYPFALDLAGTTGVHEVQVGITIFRDRLITNNPSSSYDFIMDFMVYQRSIGS